MTDLPEISFNGAVFSPVDEVPHVLYEVSLTDQKIKVIVWHIVRDIQNPKIVTDYCMKESKVFDRKEIINDQDYNNRYNILLKMGASAIFLAVSGLLSGHFLVSRNPKGFALSAATILGSAASTAYYSNRDDRAQLDFAAQAIRAAQGSDVVYNPYHYGL